MGMIYSVYDSNFKKITEGNIAELENYLDISESILRGKWGALRNGLGSKKPPYVVKKGIELDDPEELKKRILKNVKTYYLYDADTDELIAAGSASYLSDCLGVITSTIYDVASSKKVVTLRKKDLTYYIVAKKGVSEKIPLTRNLEDRKGKNLYRGPSRTKSNFVEVFPFFRAKEKDEEQKKWVTEHFSIVNLEKVKFSLEESFKDGIPYRIIFTYQGKKVCEEKYYDKKIAYMRYEYFKTFKAKEKYGVFYFGGEKFECGDVVAITRAVARGELVAKTRFFLKGDRKKDIEASQEKHTELIQFLKEEFIR